MQMEDATAEGKCVDRNFTFPFPNLICLRPTRILNIAPLAPENETISFFGSDTLMGELITKPSLSHSC